MTTAYKPTILTKWPDGWNRIDTPCPLSAYKTGANIRLTETNIPERRGGTVLRNTTADGMRTGAKDVINAMKYYPKGRTEQWVAASGTDIYFSTDGTNFASESQTITDGAEVSFEVFPVGGEDNLFVVTGSERLRYIPDTDTWTAIIGADAPANPTIVVRHGDRLWLIEDDLAYYSDILSNAWDTASGYLSFARQGETIKAGVSFNGDFVVFRQNSIGVLRGGDPVSGVKINTLVDDMGTTAHKSVVEATYRGQKALYFVTNKGDIAVFNGYKTERIDPHINLSGLISASRVQYSCAGVQDNRYIIFAYTSSSGTVNDSAIVYDTERDRFIAHDTGYYASCFFNTSGGSDTGTLYFGTSQDLGTVYRFDSGTVDEDNTALGTDGKITQEFETGDFLGGSPAMQSRLRRICVSADVSAGTVIDVEVYADGSTTPRATQFVDTRSTNLWGRLDATPAPGSGLLWGTVANGGSGAVWGGDVQRKFITWNLEAGADPYSYRVKLSNDAGKTIRLHALEAYERPRTPN
jgi:hypothetical protein